MIDETLINLVLAKISITSKLIKTEEYLNQVVNILADVLGYLFVEIFLLDTTKRWAVSRAGSGKIGEVLKEHDRRISLVKSNNLGFQVGSVITLNEIRLTKWTSGEILSYIPPSRNDITQKMPAQKSTYTDVAGFSSPELPLTVRELCLPLRVNDNNEGALVLHSKDMSAFGINEIKDLQIILDQIGNNLAAMNI